jgi:GT2 family glycosyltransferase
MLIGRPFLIDRILHVLRFARTVGPRQAAVKTVAALRRNGLREIGSIARNVWTSAPHRLVSSASTRNRGDYAEWVRRYDTVTGDDMDRMRQEASGWVHPPVISVVMPTYNPQREWLIAAIESVRGQAYPHWQLCIADDASPQQEVREVLRRYAATDPRIVIDLRTTNGHISAASNSALALATGEWVALLDHDDILPPHALYWIAKTAVEQPAVQMIYSDEDKIDADEQRFGPYFKPDWNPDLFLSQNMFSHLGAFRTELMRAVGGFRVGFEGAQDYDLALRCGEAVRPDQIAHVPRVLYHWRTHALSTASSHDAKPYAQTAGRVALDEHFARTGRAASAERTPSGYRVRDRLPQPTPRVGIVVLGCANPRRRKATHSALLSTDYPDLRIYVTRTSRRGRADARMRQVAVDAATQECEAAIGLAVADGCEVLCLMQDGAIPKSRDWLTEMVAHALRPEVGAVGCRLVDPEAKVLSAGVALLHGLPSGIKDLFAGFRSDYHGHGGRAQLVQRCTAVRASCLAVRTESLRKAMGHGRRPDANNGLDLCLELNRLGLFAVWTPHADVELPAALKPFEHITWTSDRPFDPTYNPNLYLRQCDFTLAWPPKVTPTGDRGV